MSVITDPEPNLWQTICREYERERKGPDYKEDNEPSEVDIKFQEDGEEDINGYVLVDVLPKVLSTPSAAPDKAACAPRPYLEYFIFPTLLPALGEMLRQAKLEKCFERKRTKFSALDFLTEYLYRKNPEHDDRDDKSLMDIPFVQEWLKEHPRPPLPMSLIWSEEEAALIIQSFWRGYKVRLDPEVQELRKWQRDWRLESEDIKAKVQDFWAHKMPADAEEAEVAADATPSNAGDDAVGDAVFDDIIEQKDPQNIRPESQVDTDTSSQSNTNDLEKDENYVEVEGEPTE